MHLVPIPALADNYIWLLYDDDGMAIVVDPGDSTVVEQALDARSLRLCAILLTHHHADHIGGVTALLARHDVAVYAPVDERIGTATNRVHDGDVIELSSPNARFEVIAVPGHTLTHVAYAGEGLLFCGDTLFSLGCGRLFEGTPAQMVASLDRLSGLPGPTLVCGGHEYTVANGRFAITVEPHNPDLQTCIQAATAQRARHQPTVPTPLADELATNPFLRIDSEPVIDWYLHTHGFPGDRIARFAALREAKNTFVS